MKLRQYAPRLLMVMLTAALATAAVGEPPAARPAGPGESAAGASTMWAGPSRSAPAQASPVTVDVPGPGTELGAGASDGTSEGPVRRPGATSGAGAANGSAVSQGPAAATVAAVPAGTTADGGAAVTPDSPAPHTSLVTPGEVSGTIERLWAEQVMTHGASPDDGTPADEAHADEAHVDVATAARPVAQTWLTTPQQRYRLATGAVDDVAPGSRVTATLGPGDQRTGHPVLALSGVLPPAAAEVGGVTIGPDTLLDFAALPAAVTHELTVVMAVPAGARADATTIGELRDRVAGPVAGYWSTQSRGQRALVVAAAHSWVQLSSSCSGSPFDLWNEVAGKVGFSSGPRKHLLVYLPTAAGCGAGLGTVGPGPESGGLMWVSYNSTDVIAHEFGHNLGLGHSNGLLCPSTSDGVYSGAWTGGCTAQAYRDYYDVMGVSWGNIGSLSTVHADTLGFLSSSDKLTVTASTRVRLAAVSGAGLRTVKINDPGGTYYVEYRPAQAGDAWLTGNWRGLDPGVLLRRVNPGDSRESVLLDGSVTGGTRTDDWQAALSVGRTLTTASGRTSITVDSADSSGATVTVALDGQAPPPPVGTPPDGAQVTFAAPANGARVAAGVTTFSGVATAPGGTLLWQVTQGSTVRASGFASTGGDGVFDAFSFPVSLPSGSYTVRAWVPDESDGEGSVIGTARFSSSLTVTVS